MKALFIFLLISISALCYDSGAYLIYSNPTLNWNITSGLAPTFTDVDTFKLDLFIDYGDACTNNSLIHMASERNQCSRRVGINNMNPTCALDVIGDVCLAGVPIVSSPWRSTSFLVQPASINTVQTFTPSLGTLVDIAFVHDPTKAFTRTSSNSSSEYGLDRGEGAIDFQMNRTLNTQVAAGRLSSILNGEQILINGSAEYSAVLGGRLHRSYGQYCFTGNGLMNVCEGKHGFIGQGWDNLIESGGEWCSVGNGQSNLITSTGNYNTIINGEGQNTNSVMAFGIIGNGEGGLCSGASYCFMGNGRNNYAHGFTYITILNGQGNDVAGSQSSVLGGSSNLITSDNSVIVQCDTCTVRSFRSGAVLGYGHNVNSDYSLALYGNGLTIQSGGSFNLVGGDNTKIDYFTEYCHAFGLFVNIGNFSGSCWALGVGVNVGPLSRRFMVLGDIITMGSQVTNSFALGQTVTIGSTVSNGFALGNQVSLGTNTSGCFAFGNSVAINDGTSYSFAFGNSVTIVRKSNIFAFGTDIIVTPTLNAAFPAQQLFGVGLRNEPFVGLFTAFGQYNNVAASYVNENRIFTYGVGFSVASPANLWSFTNTGNMRITGSYLGTTPLNQANFYEHRAGTKLEPGIVVQMDYDDGTIEPCEFYSPENCFGVVTEVGSAFVGDAYEEEWQGKYIRTLERGQYKKKINPKFDYNREYKPRSSRDEWHIIVTSGMIEIKDGEPVHPLWRRIPNKKNPPAMEGYSWYYLRNT